MTFFLETELAGVVGLLKLGLVSPRLNLVLFQSKILNNFLCEIGNENFHSNVFISRCLHHCFQIMPSRVHWLPNQNFWNLLVVFACWIWVRIVYRLWISQGPVYSSSIYPICVGFIVVCLVLYVFLQFFRAASRWFVDKWSIFLMHIIFKAALEFVVT